MRCKACNRILEESELTKRDANGDFLDLCNILSFCCFFFGLDSETMEYYQYEIFTDDENYDAPSTKVYLGIY